MFDFAFLRRMSRRERNLPRLRVTTVENRQMNTCLATTNVVEMFFLDSHAYVDNSNLSLLGLRSQRLFRDGETSIAVLMNFLRSQYSSPGNLALLNI